MTQLVPTSNDPIKATIPDVGDLYIKLTSPTRIAIQGQHAGLSVNGMLYHFSAHANKLGGQWLLEYDSISLTGLRGKVRESFLYRVTLTLNATMEQHGDMADRLATHAWLSEYQRLRRQLESNEQSMHYEEARVAASRAALEEKRKKFAQYVGTKPEGLELPEGE